MSTLRPQSDDRRSTSRARSRSVRWRLWVAMLALALVPTMTGFYLTTSVLTEVDTSIAGERARETSSVAASLLAREQAIEARLLVAASDPAMAQLVDGIDGATEEQMAARVLSGLQGYGDSIVTGACIVRTSDGKRISLATGNDRSAGCAESPLQQRALVALTDMVAQGAADADGNPILMLATPLRSVPKRNSGVLSAEVDVAALFDRARTLGGEAVSSMLVDMGSSEIVATTPVSAGPVNNAEPPDLEAVTPLLPGVVADQSDSHKALAAMGLTTTVVPLWSNGESSRMGLVQLWLHERPPLPLEVRLTLLALLAGVIVAAIFLVRYFLRPVHELAESRDELQLLYREARQDSLADALTGLGNHRAFQDQLGRQIKEFEMRGSTFSLVLMDLDDLKVVNDRDGHAAGDEMLVSMARTMRDLARHEDLLYRTGGDEFAMLLPRTNIDEAVSVAERILYHCKRPTTGARPSPFSAGVSGVPYFAAERELVYRQADAALYWAKRNYRGTVEVFEAERDLLPDEQRDTPANAVAEVISGKLLRPVFQPIVDLRSGRIIGFEGLIRPDPDGPLPDTGRLFTAAAASGRTVDLDLACIETLVNAAGAIGPDRLLTLNLSPRTLETKDFDAAWLLSGLVRNGISPSRVIIELTEREEVDDLGRLQQTFNLLQQYGLRLAADDVGAGNSGLRLLSQVQFDIVKIDLALVQSGVRRQSARAVLESLRDLALSQNTRMIAEGVETARQLQVIRELDIGAAQGFLLGRPDASVAMTHVNVDQLESGVVVPKTVLPHETLPPAGAVGDADIDGISQDPRAIFLPPASGLEPNAGTA